MKKYVGAARAGSTSKNHVHVNHRLDGKRVSRRRDNPATADGEPRESIATREASVGQDRSGASKKRKRIGSPPGASGDRDTIRNHRGGGTGPKKHRPTKVARTATIAPTDSNSE
ncbi:hypothetical protein PSTT_12637 [Puccinia striiformis]|uniref:Uncharacterized protein n=1 Tax=Puccinia striiformis TaxID=27350 RepID=A0A2S4UVG7_9BASI|nr:hypothetical protein PSTT_12637 [Puccinia striiformis]